MRQARIHFDAPHRRWPRWMLAALAAALLAAWALRPPARPVPPTAPASRSEPVPVAGDGAAPSEPAPRPPVERRLVRPAVAEPEPAVAEDADPPACADSPVEPEADPRRRWLAALQSSAEDRARAAGWLVGLVDAADEAPTLRDRLATLAATSRDGVVQAYAWRACRGDAALSSACQAIEPDAWARVEPDNASAWLAMAVDPRLDEPAQFDALRRAAASTRLDSHGPELHALAQAAQPRGAGGLDRVMMARDIVEARADWLGSEALRQHCSARVTNDAERRAPCDALATLLAARAQSLPDLLEARETGQRVGWPAERLDALRDEEQALAALDRQRFDAPQAMSCGMLARQDAFYADVGRLGEVAALREAMHRSPR